MTKPGKRRDGPWVRRPDGTSIRVTVRRGFDCRERCEHSPPVAEQNHGMSFDEWTFEYLAGDVAAVVQCLSNILNGEIDPEFLERRKHALCCGRSSRSAAISDPLGAINVVPGIALDYEDYRTRTIYGARVMVHHKDPNGDDGCDLFGKCAIDFCGYLYSAKFFERDHSEALEPLATKLVDEIDLDAVAKVMAPLWSKLGVLVEERGGAT